MTKSISPWIKRLIFTLSIGFLLFAQDNASSTHLSYGTGRIPASQGNLINPTVKIGRISARMVEFQVIGNEGNYTYVVAHNSSILSINESLKIIYTIGHNVPPNYDYAKFGLPTYGVSSFFYYSILIPEKWEAVYLATYSVCVDDGRMSDLVLIHQELSPDYYIPPSPNPTTPTSPTTTTSYINPPEPSPIYSLFNGNMIAILLFSVAGLIILKSIIIPHLHSIVENRRGNNRLRTRGSHFRGSSIRESPFNLNQEINSFPENPGVQFESILSRLRVLASHLPSTCVFSFFIKGRLLRWKEGHLYDPFSYVRISSASQLSIFHLDTQQVVNKLGNFLAFQERLASM